MSIDRRRLLLASAAAVPLAQLAGCVTPAPRWREDAALAAAAPPAPREFRGAWIATVANIDWPSRRGLTREEQQAELRALLDRAVELKLNAVIVQIRTSADALYESALEPWSEYLTGTQGQSPGYDPLALWIAEAHQRGLELHAWFNPFRARQSGARSAPAANHVSRMQPDWVRRYGDQLWIDPGEPAAAEHTLAVFRDVLRRYDVDAIHIDDYFYPYPIVDPQTKQELDFPDEPSWQRYVLGGGTLARADWRRQNVDQLIERLYRMIRALKPQVRFGISPFGLPKPALRPEGIAGFSQYDKLHADVERWLAEGWLDDLVPQLYWPRAQTAQAFGPLLDYWHAQNPHGRHVWPGLFTSKVLAADKLEASWPVDEITAQIELVREKSPSPSAAAASAQGSGHAHFSMVALAQNRRGLADALKAGPYAEAALVPATPWLASATAPPRPTLDVTERPDGRLLLTPRGGDAALPRHALWLRRAGRWSFAAMSGPLEVEATGLDAIVLSALDRAGIEGPRTGWSGAAP